MSATPHRDYHYPTSTWYDPRAQVRDSVIEGKGMFAAEPIREGEVVAVLGGTPMTTAEFEEYISKAQQWSALQVGEDTHLVELPPASARSSSTSPTLSTSSTPTPDTPEPEEGPGGMNHSCDSNLWMLDEVTMVARRDIAAGEEITIDYGLVSALPGDALGELCQCGSPHCRGAITGDDWKLKDVQERYRDHFSPFLNQRIRRLAGGAR